jgi:DNA-binding transcriptional MerR regulator
VLRYWESEFPALAPAKNSSGQRIYRRKDIETVLRIKQLLYDEGFTIAGAKKRLEAEMSGRGPTPMSMAVQAPVPDVEPPAALAEPVNAVPDTAPVAKRGSKEAGKSAAVSAAAPAKDDDDAEKLRAVLVEMRKQLREMLTLLDRGAKNI